MASDSRLTFGSDTRADIGIKLLRMPCRIYGPWQNQQRSLVCEIDVAMLVAGSHVTSTVTKESLEEVLKGLQAIPGQTRVSFEKVAKICFEAYRQISAKVCDALLGPKGIAAIQLAGYCPEQRQVRIFEFSTNTNTNMHCCEEILKQAIGFRLMGSGRQAAERHIRDSGCTAYEALHRVIDLNEEASVGGPIQYGIFEGEEFRIYLQTELRNGKVRYPRGGLDLNASVFSDGADDLFLSVRMLEQGKILSPD
jgi:hypothetical protein